MEPVEVQQPSDPAADPVCVQCGIHLSSPPSRIQLCENCRNAFINYPIPKWIKIFGIAILIVLAFSIISVSRNLQTGIHYERGLAAAHKKNYLTAQREFDKVVKSEPGYTEAQCRLLMAAFYNDDLQTVFSAFNKIKDEKVEDENLYHNVENVLSQAVLFLPSDSFNQLSSRYNERFDSIPKQEIAHYMEQNPDDLYATSRFAILLQDRKQFAEADSLLSIVLNEQPEYAIALNMKISLKREMEEFDSAYYFVERLLSINHENTTAMAAKARVLLKEKKDNAALYLAKKCCTYDDKNPYSICTLALVYHFKNDFKNRDAILATIERDSSAMSSLAYVRDVISGKEKFRN
jgi:tetratricopeptide (TPR) repeat protein